MGAGGATPTYTYVAPLAGREIIANPTAKAAVSMTFLIMSLAFPARAASAATSRDVSTLFDAIVTRIDSRSKGNF
jgi:hypothetical protein